MSHFWNTHSLHYYWGMSGWMRQTQLKVSWKEHWTRSLKLWLRPGVCHLLAQWIRKKGRIYWGLLGRKVMTNLDSIFKSRDITLPAKVRLVKATVFPVVMYGCESWTVKKAERRRIDASEVWCWRRPLRVPWTAMRSNQSILKVTSPGCSLEGLMLRLKL